MDGISETAFWAALAADYLRSLFAAAMLAGLDASDVAGWIRRNAVFAEAQAILRAHGMDVHARQLAGISNEPAQAAEAIRAAMLRPFACLDSQS
jgi:hypothetical protein